MMDVVDEDEDDFVLGMRAAGRAIVHDIRDGEEGCDGEGYGVQDDMQCAEGEGDLDDEEARALDSLGRDGDAFLDLTYETSDSDDDCGKEEIDNQMSSSATSEPDVLPEFDFPEIRGRYRILEKIGEGTFSSVFSAEIVGDELQRVALKRVYSTSSPARVANEIRHLKATGGMDCAAEKLENCPMARCSPPLSIDRGKHFVGELLGCHRAGGNVTLVLPFFEHDDFAAYFRKFQLADIRKYMKSLFQALNHVHRNKIIHRDVKPANFLHNRCTGEYMLVDFGLAQLENDQRHADQPAKKSQLTCKKESSVPRWHTGIPCPGGADALCEADYWCVVVALGFEQEFGCLGVEVDIYGAYIAAIDVWAAGVILLSILSGRYPFFNAPDDMTALVEIACVLGSRELTSVAATLGKMVILPKQYERKPWRDMCARLESPIVGSKEVYDLLDRCLELDPRLRITAGQALRHPFITGQKDQATCTLVHYAHHSAIADGMLQRHEAPDS